MSTLTDALNLFVQNTENALKTALTPALGPFTTLAIPTIGIGPDGKPYVAAPGSTSVSVNGVNTPIFPDFPTIVSNAGIKLASPIVLAVDPAIKDIQNVSKSALDAVNSSIGSIESAASNIGNAVKGTADTAKYAVLGIGIIGMLYFLGRK